MTAGATSSRLHRRDWAPGALGVRLITPHPSAAVNGTQEQPLRIAYQVSYAFYGGRGKASRTLQAEGHGRCPRLTSLGRL